MVNARRTKDMAIFDDDTPQHDGGRIVVPHVLGFAPEFAKTDPTAHGARGRVPLATQPLIANRATYASLEALETLNFRPSDP
jgi:hypothetical protein